MRRRAAFTFIFCFTATALNVPRRDLSQRNPRARTGPWKSSTVDPFEKQEQEELQLLPQEQLNSEWLLEEQERELEAALSFKVQAFLDSVDEYTDDGDDDGDDLLSEEELMKDFIPDRRHLQQQQQHRTAKRRRRQSGKREMSSPSAVEERAPSAARARRSRSRSGGGDRRLTMRPLDGVIGTPPMMLRMSIGLFAGALMLWSATESSSTLW